MHRYMVGWFPKQQMEQYVGAGHVLIAEHITSQDRASTARSSSLAGWSAACTFDTSSPLLGLIRRQAAGGELQALEQFQPRLDEQFERRPDVLGPAAIQMLSRVDLHSWIPRAPARRYGGGS
jgi:hypothetical protein